MTEIFKSIKGIENFFKENPIDIEFEKTPEEIEKERKIKIKAYEIFEKRINGEIPFEVIDGILHKKKITPWTEVAEEFMEKWDWKKAEQEINKEEFKEYILLVLGNFMKRERIEEDKLVKNIKDEAREHSIFKKEELVSVLVKIKKEENNLEEICDLIDTLIYIINSTKEKRKR